MIKRILKIFLVIVILALAVFGVLFATLPPSGQPTILMYHFIGSEKDAASENNFVTLRAFADQMSFLKRFGYRVISLDEYLEILEGRRRPRGREVVITFDDGHYTFFTLALPILDRYRFPVTVFLTIRNIGGRMRPEMIRELLKRPWFRVGSHAKNHFILTELGDEQLRDELEGSKRELESLFGAPVRFLAYPGGVFDARVVAAAQKAGYALAFTTSPKKLKRVAEDRFSLTRTKISSDADHPLSFWVHVSGIYQAYKRWRQELKMPA
ncbi:MAG: polysaccharide deacetylase family protein [Candidatus Omnitrophota bacterium]|jgi:peptidoglycan/xylan/chitin deacetylase (PgdA/CDA1 family)